MAISYNAKMINEIEKYLKTYMNNARSVDPAKTLDFNGNSVTVEDAPKYNNLMQMLDILTFDGIGKKDLYIYGNIAIPINKYDKFMELLYSEHTEVSIPKPLLEFGYIPGTKIFAPTPAPDNKSMDEMEEYYIQYYSRHGILPEYDKNGVRKPYPHEVYQWTEEGPKSVPGYVSTYYRQYVAEWASRKGFNNTNTNANTNTNQKVDDTKKDDFIHLSKDENVSNDTGNKNTSGMGNEAANKNASNINNGSYYYEEGSMDEEPDIDENFIDNEPKKAKRPKAQRGTKYKVVSKVKAAGSAVKEFLTSIFDGFSPKTRVNIKMFLVILAIACAFGFAMPVMFGTAEAIGFTISPVMFDFIAAAILAGVIIKNKIDVKKLKNKKSKAEQMADKLTKIDKDMKELEKMEKDVKDNVYSESQREFQLKHIRSEKQRLLKLQKELLSQLAGATIEPDVEEKKGGMSR